MLESTCISWNVIAPYCQYQTRNFGLVSDTRHESNHLSNAAGSRAARRGRRELDPEWPPVANNITMGSEHALITAQVAGMANKRGCNGRFPMMPAR
ncbi:hypothetical protein EVAR_14879_1 [Eumeta japonica]|uniref:Uncharacterized protein n=1 Tax=Eumeta variegata TaxID=151549 RepID=A0A4C1V309_EUMVA|nr:hypothetical protein EVAR_14879_1 [Eumeta japonica]